MKALGKMALYASPFVVAAAVAVFHSYPRSEYPVSYSRSDYSVDDYDALAARVNSLEVDHLLAKGDARKLNAIDVELKPLKAALIKLQPSHEEEVKRRRLEEERAEEEKRFEDERRRAEDGARRETDLQKHCDALKTKRVGDLTLNDFELLKECGVSVPRFPAVQ